MHSLSASFILGYHGCDRATGERLLRNEEFRPSQNDFDWLGSGVYFWEANPDRALDWAVRRASRNQAQASDAEPFVVGAVIDPGYCLDLVSDSGLGALEDAYTDFCDVTAAAGGIFPENYGGEGIPLRKLDCAVINYVHLARSTLGKQAFDTVRGMFAEGHPIYKNSGFHRKTHIQICVRNADVIKGVFRVPDRHFSRV